MDSTAVALLRDWSRTEGSDFVFTNAAGSRIGWLQHGFRKALGRAGLIDPHFHDLRHTFASQRMMAGSALYVLRSILGHKSIAVTQRYAHLSPAYKRVILEPMEQIWAKPASQPANIPITVPENRPRLLKRHTHPTKTALAVNA
jgi:integrase